MLDFTIYGLNINIRYKQLLTQIKLECGPMSNLMVATCPDNMVNFDLLTAEICWRVWGTPTNFNGFCVLAALLHGI